MKRIIVIVIACTTFFLISSGSKHQSFNVCQLGNPDSSLCGVILDDQHSANKILGLKWQTVENGEFPHQSYYSSNHLEVFTVYFHYGDGKYQWSEMEVSRDSTKNIIGTLDSATFVSGNGIHLGMTSREIISILGNCNPAVIHPPNTILKYRLDDFNNSEFLKRFKMPVYCSEYEFENDRLVRFRFGFEYP